MVQVGVREERKASRLLYICVIRNAVRGRTTSSCATVPIYYTTRPVLRQQAISGTRKSLHHHHYRQAGKATPTRQSWETNEQGWRKPRSRTRVWPRTPTHLQTAVRSR